MTEKPALTIHFCTQCDWLLRSAWMAQEVLSTFSLEMGAVTLVPGTGGIFEIHLDGELIWERKRDGGFPDVKTRQSPTSSAVMQLRYIGARLGSRPDGACDA